MFKGSRHNGGIRWSKRRSWDLFSHLAPFIASELRAFKKYNINGVPQDFVSTANKFDCNDVTEKGMELWHDAIEKMWWSFNEIANDHPNSPYNIAWNKYWDEVGQYRKAEDWSYEKDGHHYYKSDDKFIPPSKEEQEAYNAKVKNGLHLFAEYFEDLWD